ncbi:MAG: hypothetical protein U9N83_06875 [Thermodesulfobacteriota bacterium]|nr:hypothetical protein [Thermodesulfobacteriota bacterium]
MDSFPEQKLVTFYPLYYAPPHKKIALFLILDFNNTCKIKWLNISITMWHDLCFDIIKSKTRKEICDEYENLHNKEEDAMKKIKIFLI